MSNSGRVDGGMARKASPEIEMAAFDQLPEKLRRVLREATYKWPARNILYAIQEGKTVENIIHEISIFEAISGVGDAYKIRNRHAL